MKKMVFLLVALIIFGIMPSTVCYSEVISYQKNIRKVEAMPSFPSTYKLKDWKDVAIKLDSVLFDASLTGENYLPIGYWDDSKINVDFTILGMPSYVGMASTMGQGQSEGITLMSAILNSSLVGIDKSNQNNLDYVRMAKAFYVKSQGVVLNRMRTTTGNSFWYELMPQIQFCELAYLYPNVEGILDTVRSSSNVWYDVTVALLNTPNKFNYTGYDILTKTPKDNNTWLEPHSAAGLGYIMYLAYQLTAEQKYLDKAMACMDWLEAQKDNPYYEILLDYAPILAAKLNSQYNKQYDVEKYINWLLDGDGVARPGLGVITGKWGEYDVDGIIGSQTDGGGYAFAMNTFHTMGYLVPVAKYDQRYARAIGKLLLNSASNARLFYPDELPQENQTCAWWNGDPQHTIAYEGLRKEWQGKSPVAMGDPTVYGWGPTDFGIYGGSHVGIFGAVISPTNVEKIIRLDCNKTDFYGDKTYPTYLYYNPFQTSKTIDIQLDDGFYNIYDSVSNSYLLKNVSGVQSISIPADSCVVAVITPANHILTEANGEIKINNITVSKRYPTAKITNYIKQGETVFENISINFENFVPIGDTIARAKVKFGDILISDKNEFSNVVNIDTRLLNNKKDCLSVEIETAKGFKDKSSVMLNMFNPRGETVYLANAQAISTFASAPMVGKAELNNSVAIISEANLQYTTTYGGVRTPKISLDFSRKPLLVLNIKTVNPAWFIQVKLPNEQNGFYVSNERSDTGRIVIDLVEMMQKYHSSDFDKYKNTTVNDVELYLVAFGKQRASFDIESLQIIYPDNSMLSPYQSLIDIKNKLFLKETAGEYWLINPTNTIVNGSYISAQYQVNDNSKTLKSSNVIPFSINTNRGISFEKNILKEDSFKFFAIDGFNTLKPLLDAIIDVTIPK